jgi:hypothetical protein
MGISGKRDASCPSAFFRAVELVRPRTGDSGHLRRRVVAGAAGHALPV